MKSVFFVLLAVFTVEAIENTETTSSTELNVTTTETTITTTSTTTPKNITLEVTTQAPVINETREPPVAEENKTTAVSGRKLESHSAYSAPLFLKPILTGEGVHLKIVPKDEVQSSSPPPCAEGIRTVNTYPWPRDRSPKVLIISVNGLLSITGNLAVNGNPLPSQLVAPVVYPSNQLGINALAVDSLTPALQPILYQQKPQPGISLHGKPSHLHGTQHSYADIVNIPYYNYVSGHHDTVRKGNPSHLDGSVHSQADIVNIPYYNYISGHQDIVGKGKPSHLDGTAHSLADIVNIPFYNDISGHRDHVRKDADDHLGSAAIGDSAKSSEQSRPLKKFFNVIIDALREPVSTTETVQTNSAVVLGRTDNIPGELSTTTNSPRIKEYESYESPSSYYDVDPQLRKLGPDVEIEINPNDRTKEGAFNNIDGLLTPMSKSFLQRLKQCLLIALRGSMLGF